MTMSWDTHRNLADSKGFVLVLTGAPFHRGDETRPDTLDEFSVGKSALFLLVLDGGNDLQIWSDTQLRQR